MVRIERVILLAAGVLLCLSGAARAQDRVVETQTGPIRVETVAAGLVHPWAHVFLPDGSMLVTERPGRLRVVTRDGRISAPLAGVPQVYAQGQGGLLDVALDPDFAANRLVYLTYSEPGQGGAATAAARGRLNATATALENVQVIFRQQPQYSGGIHFGSRLAFARDGKLFVTTGDRRQDQAAQDLSQTVGKIVRINPDASVPADNPFAGRPGARPEIWSYGHRNVQGAAVHPATGVLWAHEMGPRGGDELNVVLAGHNYGWPLVSWGTQYSGVDIPDPPTRPNLTDAVRYWVPSISPSGMTFYTGTMLPGWRGNILIGALSGQALVRVVIEGNRATGDERIAMGSRIRDVRQGPDGAVYLLTDHQDGKLLRLTPARR